jgi:hypothetical protein
VKGILLNHNGTPEFYTAAEADTARGYVRACAADEPGWETLIPRIDAMSDDRVIACALRLWPQGWVDFCTYFAADIRAAEQESADRWHAEATGAARGHLFASRLPDAALRWGRCTLTATEAVTTLGADIAQLHRDDGMSWREIAEILGVPIPVAMVWAAEGRARGCLIAAATAFRTSTTGQEI